MPHAVSYAPAPANHCSAPLHVLQPGAIVPHVYEYTVAKLFALYGRTAEGWVRSAWRRFQTLLSYALRVTSRFVLQWTLPVVSERGMKQALGRGCRVHYC